MLFWFKTAPPRGLQPLEEAEASSQRLALADHHVRLLMLPLLLLVLLAMKRPAAATRVIAVEEVLKRSRFEPHISQMAAARITGGEEGVGGRRMQMKRIMWEPTQVVTPYGNIIKEMRFDLGVPYAPMVVKYICPFVWLYWACGASSLFAHLLCDFVGVRRIMLYSDETMPGNVLRPDKGRSFCAVYWGVLPLPDWFRARAQWLHTLTYVSEKRIKNIPGGVSALYVKLMECFWGAELNLERLGMRLPCRGVQVLMRFRFGCFLSDEKAERDIVGVKGAAGTRMCLSCMNCVNCLPERITEASGMTHYSCSDMSRFQPHTVQSFNETLDHVKDAHATMGVGAFKLEMQCAGIAYNEFGLMYSHMRDIAQVPTSRYPDWFHNVVASGGVVQYQVNVLALALVSSCNLSLKDIDEFEIVFPKAWTNITKTFFRDRVVKKKERISTSRPSAGRSSLQFPSLRCS